MWDSWCSTAYQEEQGLRDCPGLCHITPSSEECWESTWKPARAQKGLGNTGQDHQPACLPHAHKRSFGQEIMAISERIHPSNHCHQENCLQDRKRRKIGCTRSNEDIRVGPVQCGHGDRDRGKAM